MAGIFFNPKELSSVSDQALLAYRDQCDLHLRDIQLEFAVLDGRLRELNDSFAFDGVVVGGGVIIAGVGIAITAVFTFGGALGLVGGALSLVGAHRYADRLVKRSLVSDQVKSRRETIAFLMSELKRVQEEMDRRTIA